ncbi:MAG: NAD(P)H-binding protein [Ignavibacteria bacterium]|nr:NAD(P)H-binding protein [Ignavibacteria bacterium]
MSPEAHPVILITGAAGNLGGVLARHLIDADCQLRLMVHRTPLSPELQVAANVTPVLADLADPATLSAAVAGADVVVHFAGVLFAPGPEHFLPETNTRWFANLLDACLEARVGRVILVSFPHVEGPTDFEHPATGRLDAHPVSVHARTRLEEERLLFARCEGSATVPVVLRLGMVYGRGILMVDAARWFARHRLLGVWRKPTWIQLISTADYLAATEAAIMKPDVRGIYHIGDELPVTLQHFLETACRAWGLPPPRRMPLWLIFSAAWLCELFARVLRKPSPLTRDFIRIGRVSYWGDTRRARAELLPTLRYPTLEDGAGTL